MIKTQFQDVHPIRLDKFLAHTYQELSREQVKKLIHQTYVSLNGKSSTKPSQYVSKGDIVEVDMSRWKRDQYRLHQPIVDGDISEQVQVVYEHEDFVIVNKPAGLLVHRTNAPHSFSLVEIMRERYPEIEGVQDTITSRNDGNTQDRSGIVHRIDRDTSGLVIITRNFDAFYWFKRIFAERDIVKRYKCLVHGRVIEEMGEITFPITRSKTDHSKRVPILNASDIAFYDKKKSARTEYTVNTRYQASTLLDVYLHTGRTHQIRVHMKAIGHPIIGDPHYGVIGNATDPPLQRQFLHADHLAFTYKGQSIQVTSKLPPDLVEYLKQQQ